MPVSNQIPYKRSQTVLSSFSKEGSSKQLIALHGYGQLVEYFYKNFQGLEESGWQVICPEAPNYFYLEGFSGRVGAHWMTKHNRLQCIDENNRFLSSLLGKYGLIQTNLVGLGFSQGASTILRWAMDEKVRFKKIILWGGGFPMDYLSDSKKLAALKEIPLHFMLGKQDPFIKPQMAEELEEVFTKIGLSYSIQWYEGTHKIYPDILKQIV